MSRHPKTNDSAEDDISQDAELGAPGDLQVMNWVTTVQRAVEEKRTTPELGLDQSNRGAQSRIRVELASILSLRRDSGSDNSPSLRVTVENKSEKRPRLFPLLVLISRHKHMASLPPELWVSIVHHFPPSSATSSLASLAQVSQFFNALATPVLYHTVCFRRTAQIQLFKNAITALHELADRVRIIVFSRDIVDGTAPLGADNRSFFGLCTALRGVHIRDGHVPHPSNQDSAPEICMWLSNPTPAVRCVLLTYDGIWGPGTFSRSGVPRNIDPTLIKLPPGLETLHIEHLEYEDGQLDPVQACDTLRNLSARVVVGDFPHELSHFRIRAIWHVCRFLSAIVQSTSQLSRARIFFPSPELVHEVYEELDRRDDLQQVLADEARVQIVVYDFGPEGYAQAVYAEMCGDDALWSLGVPEKPT